MGEKFESISLALVSRHHHLTNLKNALLLIYEMHLTGEGSMERLIAKILSQPVPPPKLNGFYFSEIKRIETIIVSK